MRHLRKCCVCCKRSFSHALTLPCLASPTPFCQVGRAGRFGTKGLAITFVSSQKDSEVLNQVQERFDVDIKPLPDKIDSSSYMNTN